MRTQIATSAIIAAILAAPALAAPTLQQMTGPNQTELIIYTDSAKAVVRQHSRVRLSSGDNAVSFAWTSDRVDTASIRLEPTSEEGQGLEIGDVSQPAGKDRLLQWQVKAPEADHYDLTISFLLAGLKWETDYRLIRDADRPLATLTGWLSVTNDSGVDLKNLSTSLVLGRPGAGSDAVEQVHFRVSKLRELAPGSTTRAELMRPIQLTAWTIHRIDTESAAERVERLLEIQPPSDGALARTSLPAGPMTVIDGEHAIDANLSYEPMEAFLIPLGYERDLVVDRRLVSREKVEVEFDRLGQVSGFDTIERYEVEVRSRLDETIEVELVETVLETWELETEVLHVLEDGQAFMRMSVPGGGSTTASFTLVKHSGTRIP